MLGQSAATRLTFSFTCLILSSSFEQVVTKSVEEIFTYYYYWKVHHQKQWEKLRLERSKLKQKKSFLHTLRRKGKKVPKLSKCHINFDFHWDNLGIDQIDSDVTNLAFVFTKPSIIH